jgi:hypothetical protein
MLSHVRSCVGKDFAGDKPVCKTACEAHGAVFK